MSTKTEKQKHQNKIFFFNEYKKLPPMLRTITNLYDLLQHKQDEEELPFKLPAIDTIRKYRRIMEWDKRIIESLGTNSKTNHMINTDHFMNELWEDAIDYHQRTRQQKDKIEWNKVESLDDTTRIQNLKAIQDQYDKSFKTLTGTPISIAEMYAMLEVLKATEQEENNQLDLTDKLLNKGNDKK